MKYELFHDITFDALYGCIAVLFFVILERGIYLSYIGWRMRQLATIVDRTDRSPAHEIRAVKWTDPASRALARYGQILSQGANRERQEDLSSALFIGFDKKVSGRLWILDTIVTAAPLLGLLGTIFGIMETFNSLAAGGVSDSAAVSRGIGTALVATAIGIATALLGLLGNNVLSRRVHVLTEDFKALLLSLTVDADAELTQGQSHGQAQGQTYAALPTALRPRGISPR
jgi:biopolymer transport protein ExbB